MSLQCLFEQGEFEFLLARLSNIIELYEKFYSPDPWRETDHKVFAAHFKVRIFFSEVNHQLFSSNVGCVFFCCLGCGSTSPLLHGVAKEIHRHSSLRDKALAAELPIAKPCPSKYKTFIERLGELKTSQVLGG